MKNLSLALAILLISIVAPCMAAEKGIPAAVAAGKAAVKTVNIYPTAVLPFQERNAGVKDRGTQISDILFAFLSTNPDLVLVDRADMQKVLEEHEINLSGMVNSSQATQVGQLTGARILITGSVVDTGKSVYLMAKIIGTETSRVLGESIKGNAGDDLGMLTEKLAEKISALIARGTDELVAKEVRTEDRIAALSEKLGTAARPKVHIHVTEHHVGEFTIDPAAETELTLFCRGTGFTVQDKKSGDAAKADILIQGEGFSEFAMRRGNLVSVKARLEVKAVDRLSGNVIAVDRQTAVVVDLTEQIAGKAALQQAAATIAERMLPKLLRK
ncbi:MAG: CsgG/HfaB family protein [bacterium]|nr:CsgG/HfaB family protein [bacterium]